MKVLLIDGDDDHAEQLTREFVRRRLIVTRAPDRGAGARTLRSRTQLYDLVILFISGNSGSWRTDLHELQQACRHEGFLELPKFLLVSRLHVGVGIQLQIERMGARYASEE